MLQITPLFLKLFVDNAIQDRMGVLIWFMYSVPVGLSLLKWPGLDSGDR